jgi:hypothetical protein
MSFRCRFKDRSRGPAYKTTDGPVTSHEHVRTRDNSLSQSLLVGPPERECTHDHISSFRFLLFRAARRPADNINEMPNLCPCMNADPNVPSRLVLFAAATAIQVINTVLHLSAKRQYQHVVETGEWDGRHAGCITSMLASPSSPPFLPKLG